MVFGVNRRSLDHVGLPPAMPCMLCHRASQPVLAFSTSHIVVRRISASLSHPVKL